MLFGYAVFTSCSDDIADFSFEENRRPLEISASLNMEAPKTKATGPIMGTSLPTKSELGVCVYAKSNAGTFLPYGSDNAYDNNRWVNMGNETNPNWQADKSLFLNNDLGHVFAYYPYSVSSPVSLSSDMKTVKLSINAGNTDYLYNAIESSTAVGNGNLVNAQSPVIGLKMNHALSLISFSFTQGSDYTGDCKLESLQVSAVYTSGELHLSSGNGIIPESDAIKGTKNIFHYSSDKGYTLLEGTHSFKNQQNYGAPVVNSNNNITSPGNFHFFAIPQENATLANITVRIDGESYEASLTGIAMWEAGKAYEYKLLLNRDGVVASGTIQGTIGELKQGGSVIFDAAEDTDLINEGVIGSCIINNPDGNPPGVTNEGNSTYTDCNSKGKSSKRFQVAREDVQSNNLYLFSWMDATGRNDNTILGINKTMLPYDEEGISTGWRLPTDKEWSLIETYQHKLISSDPKFVRLSETWNGYYTAWASSVNGSKCMVATFSNFKLSLNDKQQLHNASCRIRYVRDIN